MDLSASPASASAGRRPGWLDRRIAGFVQDQLAGIRDARLTVELPSGYRFVCGQGETGEHAEWIIHSWNCVWRVAQSGALGFGEAYLAREWSTPDLTGLLNLLAQHLDGASSAHNRGGLSRLIGRLRHALNANTLSGSRRNIAFHYDLGNEFYARWLDPSMTYSAGLMDSEDADLEAAQIAKYRRICDSLDLKPGDHVLEIGCGWGGFAEIAAGEYGLRVTGLTLSQEQLAFARARMERAGLADQVELRLQDYRDVEGQFDGIASIEMFEAVGEENWPVYFDTVRSRLKPGARAALQVITIREADFDAYRRTVDYIQKYIFPGGMLPTERGLIEQGESAGLEPCGHHMFGLGYARTLARWHEAFKRAWPQIASEDFDDRFDRMWRFYLAYCEAGFRAGRIDVGQFVFRAST